MSAPAKAFFADTTIVYYKLHSHPLLKEAVRSAVGKIPLLLSNFVRGEYIRGYITGLIDLCSSIKEEDSVEDGISVFNAKSGSRPRKLANAFESAAAWLYGFEDWREVPLTLRRLGETIRQRLTELDMRFPSRTRDPLECEIGVMAFPAETYDEQQIYDFLEEYERIRLAPECNQCGFRKTQEERLSAAGIDLFSESQREAHKKSK